MDTDDKARTTKIVEPKLQKIMKERDALMCKHFERDEYLIVLTEDGFEATWCDRNADAKVFKIAGMIKKFDSYGTIEDMGDEVRLLNNVGFATERLNMTKQLTVEQVCMGRWRIVLECHGSQHYKERTTSDAMAMQRVHYEMLVHKEREVDRAVFHVFLVQKLIEFKAQHRS